MYQRKLFNDIQDRERGNFQEKWTACADGWDKTEEGTKREKSSKDTGRYRGEKEGVKKKGVKVVKVVSQKGRKKVTAYGLTCSMVGRWAVTDTPGAATRPSRTESAISRATRRLETPLDRHYQSFSGACSDPREHHPCRSTEPTTNVLQRSSPTFAYAIIRVNAFPLTSQIHRHQPPLLLTNRCVWIFSLGSYRGKLDRSFIVFFI